MQNYSQALDLDMLNQRYWYRRMQQCKAEFRTNHPRPSIPTSTPSSVDGKLSYSPRSSYDRSRTSPTSQSRYGGRTMASSPMEQPSMEQPPMEQPTQPEPRLMGGSEGVDKGRPIPAISKPSRPVKYQVR